MTKQPCNLCPLDCQLSPKEIGKCRVRGNVDGKVKLLTYGQVTTALVGPVEQKPLYHYYPGSTLLSLGSSGCNMFCGYCVPAGTLIRTPIPRRGLLRRLLDFVLQRPKPTGLVPIEKMKDGDAVIAVDDSHSDLQLVSTHVGHVFDREAEEVIELQVDGRTILLTPEHPVLTKFRGWIEAGMLTGDDEVLCDESFK